MVEKELTPMEKDFCRRVAVGESRAQAYVNAGLLKNPDKRKYAGKYGYDLYKKGYIHNYIEQLKHSIEKASDKADEDIKEKVQEAVKKWDVLEWFEKVAKAEVGEEDLPRWGERIKAAENWAKINGLMDTKVNVSGDLEIEVSVVHAED